MQKKSNKLSKGLSATREHVSTTSSHGSGSCMGKEVTSDPMCELAGVLLGLSLTNDTCQCSDFDGICVGMPTEGSMKDTRALFKCN